MRGKRVVVKRRVRERKRGKGDEVGRDRGGKGWLGGKGGGWDMNL